MTVLTSGPPPGRLCYPGSVTLIENSTKVAMTACFLQGVA